MTILILGAAGFIGTNLALRLAREGSDRIILYDRRMDYFAHAALDSYTNIEYVCGPFDQRTEFDTLTSRVDLVFHLESTNMPTTSNRQIPQEIETNLLPTALMLDACVRQKVGRVVFLSSGGTVYGREGECPLAEEVSLRPITSYGLQKVAIEKLLYLYQYRYGLEYRIARFANPYGPYQRPNGKLGVVASFLYRALLGEQIQVYGNGSVVRDFVYIEDAIEALVNVACVKHSQHRTYNIGSGVGTSIQQLLDAIQEVLGTTFEVAYREARPVDVPTNVLNVSRYEEEFGKLSHTTLEQGILLTKEALERQYGI